MAHDQEAMLAGIIAKLSVTGAGTLYEAVNGRIYRTIAPNDNATEPLVIVSVVDDPPDRYFSTAADINAVINVSVYGARDLSETTMQGVNAKVITALENAAITISGHVGGLMWCQNRGIPIYDTARMQITTLWGIAATATS